MVRASEVVVLELSVERFDAPAWMVDELCIEYPHVEFVPKLGRAWWPAKAVCAPLENRSVNSPSLVRPVPAEPGQSGDRRTVPTITTMSATQKSTA